MKKKMKTNLFYGLLLLPALVLFVLFFIIPVAQSTWLSFTDSFGMKSTYHFIGLDNYKEALRDLSFRKTIGATSKYALISVVVGNILSLILALILDSKLRLKNSLRAVFFIPNIMSLLVVGYIWNFVYTSVFPDVLEGLGMKSFAILGSKTLVIPALAIVGIWNAAGYYMVIYIAALQGISEDLIEAAKIDGAGTLRLLFNIRLPLIASTVFTCLILSIAAHMKVFELPYTMTSGGPVGESTTMVYKIYTTAFNANRNGYASAQSIIMFIIIAAITLILNYIMKKREEKL
ncbi:carbohydrate ABC transporter permease [Anaerocolumna xylanovorans]|uniref:Raffinose/stachyose/melibiose transport system permease protein n=1 Tax=Anaerocolumna xylanovorans DSM 12503 TaxID=1121345 RepID=A0A1M7YGM3_9FIRM|nr:sugar ABC transporter permease [Anaerocolumna xylanovorans]SHO51770.1 raffinose/stachyose/melibiose transport system permease protein [Anaerocolumna xylanovorans DSM 12503]